MISELINCHWIINWGLTLRGDKFCSQPFLVASSSLFRGGVPCNFPLHINTLLVWSFFGSSLNSPMVVVLGDASLSFISRDYNLTAEFLVFCF